MKEITSYVTEDGTSFESIGKAQAHEAALSKESEIVAFVEEHYSEKTGRYQNTLKNILTRWEAYQYPDEKPT